MQPAGSGVTTCPDRKMLDTKENKAENEKLSQRNQMISAEIQGLTKGFESIEERARMGHDMVKPNEVFYHIVKEHK